MTLCPVCGIDFINLTNHIKFKHNNILLSEKTAEVIQPTPAVLKSSSVQLSEDSLRLKELQLQDKRLDLELEKLSKGTNTNDPWDRMFNMMQENNKQTLAMMDKNNELRIENLKLGLASNVDGEDDLLAIAFNEFAPDIHEAMRLRQIQATPPTTNTSSPKVTTPQPTEKGGNVKMNFDLRKVPKPYLKAIKDGKITQEKAWIDLQSVVKPELLPTREDFNKEFDKVKGGKFK